MGSIKTYIGCSGYHYDDWQGPFYPEGMKKEEWLSFYAEKFNSVEINNSFYNIPDKSTLKSWKERTPEEFRFTLKGSRYITHMKKLKDPEPHVKKFLKGIEPLADKTGCILWQLPGNLHVNLEKLENFCQALSHDFIHVMEFRHNSWFIEKTYDILSGYDHMAGCSLSAPGDLPENLLDIHHVAYIRFHGKGEWYNYHYSKKELQAWKNKITSSDTRQLFAYFNNDVNAHAPENAGTFKDMIR